MNINFKSNIFAVALTFALSTLPSFSAEPTVTYTVGDSVKLGNAGKKGIPLHSEVGQKETSGYLSEGSGAVILSIDSKKKHWVQVKSGDVSAWIVNRYLSATKPKSGTEWVIFTVKITADSTHKQATVKTSPPPADPVSPADSYAIGCWNLEWFSDGKERGFPESLPKTGGPKYPARTGADLDSISNAIHSFGTVVMVLEEIHSKRVITGSDTVHRSDELDVLMTHLGVDWKYIVGGSDGDQNIAMIYNSKIARLNGYRESKFDNVKVQNKEIFDRQPLIANFTFLKNGATMNDLTVAGVHLASGQDLVENHDAAMTILVKSLMTPAVNDPAIPINEKDIAIMGDFNANRFDNKKEAFWDTMESNGWDVLGDNDSTYAATRLSGHPLKQFRSKIDYIIVSKGLAGSEVLAKQATIHSELIHSDPTVYRQNYSDHLPLTVRVKIVKDDD